jgi:hypothetical protein
MHLEEANATFIGMVFVILGLVNLIWPGKPLELAGGTVSTDPWEKLILRIGSAWMLVQGLHFLHVPLVQWFPPIRHILIGA